MKEPYNEVAKDFDTLFLDYVEEHKIQLWPNKDGTWTVQHTKPFIQVTRSSLKAAMVKLFITLEEVKFIS